VGSCAAGVEGEGCLGLIDAVGRVELITILYCFVLLRGDCVLIWNWGDVVMIAVMREHSEVFSGGCRGCLRCL
jgi:hypothetical protein